jgi:2,5-diamino-6-(ribosylamino)-4(3H)-pyrimidinone 5'-phosphate reductase
MITLDAGYVSGLLDVDLYYEAGYKLGAGVVMVGADSMLEGLEGFGQAPCDETRPEQKRNDCDLPWLAITDSHARLMGKLGHYRNMEYIRDVLMLVSKATPKEYVDYLEKNSYEYYVVGDDRCDLAEGLEQLYLYHQSELVRVDAVGGLAVALLNEGLADELCVIHAPYLLKSPSLKAFEGLLKDVRLFPESTERLRNGYLLTRYRVDK